MEWVGFKSCSQRCASPASALASPTPGETVSSHIAFFLLGIHLLSKMKKAFCIIGFGQVFGLYFINLFR